MPKKSSAWPTREGFAKGESDGFNAGKQQAVPIADQLQRMLTDVDGLWQLMVTSYERQLMDLVCRVAEKIVFGHVEIEHETVKRAILDAFSVVPEPVGVTIEVNPKDYEYIETIKEDFFECISSLKDVSVSSDPSVARGGCKIRSSAGEVDATIQSRMETVRKCFLEAKWTKKQRLKPCVTETGQAGKCKEDCYESKETDSLPGFKYKLGCLFQGGGNRTQAEASRSYRQGDRTDCRGRRRGCEYRQPVQN